jgi:hypothetical protein
MDDPDFPTLMFSASFDGRAVVEMDGRDGLRPPSDSRTARLSLPIFTIQYAWHKTWRRIKRPAMRLMPNRA